MVYGDCLFLKNAVGGSGIGEEVLRLPVEARRQAPPYVPLVWTSWGVSWSPQARSFTDTRRRPVVVAMTLLSGLRARTKSVRRPL